MDQLLLPQTETKPATGGFVLKNRDNPETTQTLQFVERAPGKVDPSKLQTLIDGVEVHSVLMACRHRLQTLLRRLPCNQSFLALHHLDLSLALLREREEARVARGVKGTPQP